MAYEATVKRALSALASLGFIAGLYVVLLGPNVYHYVLGGMILLAVTAPHVGGVLRMLFGGDELSNREIMLYSSIGIYGVAASLFLYIQGMSVWKPVIILLSLILIAIPPLWHEISKVPE